MKQQRVERMDKFWRDLYEQSRVQFYVIVGGLAAGVFLLITVPGKGAMICALLFVVALLLLGAYLDYKEQ